ncbi:MAG: tetratricopeptide repeat protein, partial [bacterium]
LYEATRGHPLYFFDNFIQYTTHGRTEIQVPDKALSAATARLEALPSGLRDCLLQLAVLGESFYANILGDYLHPDPAGPTLNLLTTEGILRPSAYYPYEQYSFTSNLLWRAVYEAVAPAHRKALHRRAADLMEHAYSGRSDLFAYRIAEQYASAGCYEKAFAYFLKAAQYSRAKSNFSGAFSHLDQARALIENHQVSDNDALGQFYFESGLAKLYKGQQNDAAEHLTKALQYAGQKQNWVSLCEIHTWLGKAYIQIGAWDKAEYHLQQAKSMSNPEIVLDYYYEILYNLAYMDIYRGEVDRARNYLGEILDHVAEDDPLRAKAIANLVLLDAEQWNPSPACRYEPALEIFAKNGDRWNEAAILNNLGFYYERMNRFDEALYHYWHAYSYFYEIMNRPKFAIVTMNVGQIYLSMGELADAEQHFEIAKGFAEMSHDYDGVSMILHRRGSAAYCDGRYEEAYHFQEESVRVGLEHGFARWPVWSTIALSECLLRMNELDGAREVAERALHFAERLNDRKLRQYSLSRHGAADRLNGRPDRGAETLREVLKYAEDVGDRDLIAYSDYYLHLNIGASETTAIEELERLAQALKPIRDEEMQFRRALICLELYERTGDAESLQECDAILHVFPFYDVRWRWCAANGRHALKQGDRQQAVEWFEKGYSGLNYLASAIRTPEWKQKFLHQPEA